MECAGRILVVSAYAGHDPAAAELTRRLRGRGFAVDRLSLLDVLPGPLHRAVREAARVRRGHAPLSALTARSRLSGSVLRALLRPVRRRMRRAIPPDTRAVVTTCPAANQLFGPLRRQGRLAVPLITFVTDVAVRPVWLSPGVDVYCALPQAELPPGRGLDVRVVQPLVAVDRPGGTTGDATPGRGAASRIDPAGLVAEAAAAPGGVVAGDRERRRTLVDSVSETIGDAAAVVAALLQASGDRRTGGR